MKIRNLITEWEKHATEKLVSSDCIVKLRVHDVARIRALTELFPARQESQIITELLSAALDELEEAFPYVQGSKVTAEDEFGDPLYEDKGLTPRFVELTKKFQATLADDNNT